MVVGALPHPLHIRFSSPGKGHFHHPARSPAEKCLSGICIGDSMTKIARTPTYSRQATRETSFHGLALPHFSGTFELFGHVSRSVMKKPWFLRGTVLFSG